MNNQIIKQELLQYTARLIETSPLQNESHKGAARHDVVALMVEQALELGNKEDGTKDLFILKPILKAAIIIIKDRICQIGDMADYNYQLASLKKEYLQTINTLEKILDALSN